VAEELAFECVARLLDTGLDVAIQGEDAIAHGADGAIGSGMAPANDAQLRTSSVDRHAAALDLRLLR